MLRISSPYAESWVGWIMLVLLVLFVVAITLSPNVIRNSFTTLFSKKERENLFDESVSANFAAKLILLTFKVLLIALTLQYVAFTMAGTYPLSIVHFLIIVGMIIAYRFARWVIILLLNYVFSIDVGTKQSNVGYGKLTNCAAVLLYPILLMLLFGQLVSPMMIYWVLGIWFAAVVIVYIIKGYSIWTHSLGGFLYFTLYIITLECLPRLLLAYGAYQIILHV